MEVIEMNKRLLGIIWSVIATLIGAYVLYYFGPEGTNRLELPSSVIGRSFLLVDYKRPSEKQHVLHETKFHFKDQENMTRIYGVIPASLQNLKKVCGGVFLGGAAGLTAQPISGV